MSKDSSKKKSRSVFTVLGLVGFVVIIILIAWLSVRLANYVPGAFSSLASLAESLNPSLSATPSNDETDVNKLDNITVASNQVVANSGEEVVITWQSANKAGSYTFSYDCTEGLAVDLVSIDGLRSIACNTQYNIGDVTSLTVTADSEKERYTDLTYTIAFLATNDTSPRASGNRTLTVFNANLDEFPEVAATTNNGNDTDTKADEVSDNTSASDPIVSTPARPTTPEPTYTQEYTYAIPVSDPNGRTDLSVRFLRTGMISGGQFIPGILSQNKTGAIQFEIRNLGTKTSGNWNYTVTLPNGDVYKSKAEQPLKPNERALFSIGFPATNKSAHTFVAIVSEPTDYSSLNNSFSETVRFQ